MSIEAVGAVLEFSQARGVARNLMFVLAEHTNVDTGVCWPGKERLAHGMRCHPDSVDAAIAKCVALEELHVTSRPGRSSVYRLVLPGLESAAEQTREGAGVEEGIHGIGAFSKVAQSKKAVQEARPPREAYVHGAGSGGSSAVGGYFLTAGNTMPLNNMGSGNRNEAGEGEQDPGEILPGVAGEISAQVGGILPLNPGEKLGAPGGIPRPTRGSNSPTNLLNPKGKGNRNPCAQESAHRQGAEHGSSPADSFSLLERKTGTRVVNSGRKGRAMNDWGGCGQRAAAQAPPSNGGVYRRDRDARLPERPRGRFAAAPASPYDIPFVPAARKAEPPGWRAWFAREYPRAQMPPNWHAVPFTQKQEFLSRNEVRTIAATATTEAAR